MAHIVLQAQRNITWPTSETGDSAQQHCSQAPLPLPTHQTQEHRCPTATGRAKRSATRASPPTSSRTRPWESWTTPGAYENQR
eukprot:8387586-Pyramimonas_sp.AAC.1